MWFYIAEAVAIIGPSPVADWWDALFFNKEEELCLDA
jgi:hypothetical protein